MGESGFDALMREACVGWGFCGCIKDGAALHVTMLIPSKGTVRSAQFVEWLLLADNVNPNDPKFYRHKAALEAAFVTHMGSDVVEAWRLRWSDCPPDLAEDDPKFRGYISESEAGET